MTEQSPEPLRIEPLLVDIAAMQKLLNASRTTIYMWDQKGYLPQAVDKLHCSRRHWVYHHLRCWADAGCPHRDSPEWLALLKQLRGVPKP